MNDLVFGKPGGELEQIQLGLGHPSVQTTERDLGIQQDLVDAPNDGIGVIQGNLQDSVPPTVLYTLRRLGGMWRAIAIAMSAVPRGLRDIGYDLVARIRYRVFGRAKTVCPLVPADLRSRFQGYTIAPSGTTKESS